jgi:predicted acetyltransferase
MAHDIRPVTSETFEAFMAMLEVSAGRRLAPEVLADARETYRLEHTLAVFEGREIVGGTGFDELELTVPGLKTVAAARITHTGVRTTHREQGLLTALWTRQLSDLVERGIPVAIFTTTGPGIYGRLGYGPATLAMEIELATGEALQASADTSTLRTMDEEELPTALPALYERHRRLQPGQVSRTEGFWRVWLRDRERYRRSSMSERFAVACTDRAGKVDGYLTYRLAYGAPRDQPVRELVVEDLVTTSAEARRALWRFCLGFRQAAVMSAPNVPADEPLRWILADPRCLRITRLREFLWLRLVDVAAALEGRDYAAADSLVLEVKDRVCQQNQGRFRLEASDSQARCARTNAEADLVIATEDLAAPYLGGFTFTSLARAGRVLEFEPGAVARADAMFASRPAPWTVSDW